MCFVSLFVSVDAIGTLPMFLGLTEGIDGKTLKRVLVQSILTATLVMLVFLFAGKAVLSWIGITVADMMVTGGVLLFALSMGTLLTHHEPEQLPKDPETLGAVPIGVPLIMGPAVLTTLLLLDGEYGRLPTVLAATANILLAGAMFAASRRIHRILGKAGTRTVSKIAALVLAAFGVMMIRKGVISVLSGAGIGSGPTLG